MKTITEYLINNHISVTKYKIGEELTVDNIPCVITYTEQNSAYVMSYFYSPELDTYIKEEHNFSLAYHVNKLALDNFLQKQLLPDGWRLPTSQDIKYIDNKYIKTNAASPAIWIINQNEYMFLMCDNEGAKVEKPGNSYGHGAYVVFMKKIK